MTGEVNELTLRAFVSKWNSLFPYDLYWRKKYNVAFGSSTHMEMSFLHIALEYFEDKMIQEFEKSQKPDDTIESESGTVLKMSESEIDEEFDNLEDKLGDLYG